MKAVCLFALCLLAGWASADFAWKTGKTYTYAVRGRLMTGISEINTQYSGLEMDYLVKLTVVDRNTIVLKPTDFKILEVHDKLHGGWRDANLRGQHPVEIKAEFKTWLESPIVIILKNGVIETIHVEKELPVWAINIKKAQVSHFVLDTTGVHTVLEGNLNREVNHMHQGYKSLESGHFFETLEKTILGECKTYYTVSQNLPFVKPFPFQKTVLPGESSEESSEESNNEKMMMGEHTWHKTWHEFCHETDKVFEIIKTVNFTSCVNKPVMGFFNPSVSTNSRAGDNVFGSFGARAVISRLLACGKDRQEFTILKIRQEEQVNVGLHHKEKLVAGAIKNLTLIDICDKKDVPTIKNPLVLKDLVYTVVHNKVHDNIMSEGDDMSIVDAPFNQMVETEEDKMNIMENKILPKPTLVDPPVNPLLISTLKIDGMKKRVEVLMREIVDDLLMKTMGTESMAEKETLSKISVVAKIMRYWKLEDIEEVFHKCCTKTATREDRLLRSVFLDCCAIAGTNPCIKFLLDCIEKHIIVDETAVKIMMTLPMYIRTPTKELLKTWFNCIKMMDVEKRDLKTTGILAFTTHLHQACVNTNIRNTRFPVQMYGNFCDEKFVETEFLEFFMRELEKIIFTEDTEHNMHWKVVYLNALGNIGHPKVIPFVQKCMDNLINPFIKVKAVYVLKHLVISRSNENIRDHVKVHGVDRDSIDCVTDELIEKKVLPILVSVAFDKGEHPEVRMAAISLIMYTTNADITIWQQLAYMTWFEPSEEVKCFILTSFRTMAGLERALAPIHWKIQMRARSVLSICKPVKCSLIRSKNVVEGLYLEDHLSGLFYQLSTVASKDSMIPNMIYFRNYLHFADGAFRVNPVEFSLHGHTTQKLLNYMMEKIWVPTTEEREGHEDLSKIHEILGIMDRKQKDKVVGSFWIKIRNEMERLFTFNKEKIDKMFKEFTDVKMPKLKEGLPVEWQKTLHMGEHLVEVPSIFGIPLCYKYNMPVHINVKGHVKLVTENKAVQLQADLHPVYAWKMHHKVSFKVPFLIKKYQSGIQQHLVTELPCRILIGRGNRGQHILAITPTHLHRSTPTTNIHLITHHVKPYTAIVKDSLWPIHKKEGCEMKMVHTLEKPITMNRCAGEKLMGMSVCLEGETEYREELEGMNGWLNFLKQYKTPMGLVNLGYIGHPLIRRSIHKLSIDMSKSETKTLIFVVGGKRHVEIKTEDLNEEMSGTKERDNVGLHYVLAIVGKKTPITSCKETHGIQKVLVKGTPSTIEYLMHVMMTRDKTLVRWGLGNPVKDVCKKLPDNIPSIMAIKEVMMDSKVETDMLDYCVEINGMMDRPIHASRRDLMVLRKRLLEEDLVVKMKTEIHFGKTCTDMKHKVKIDGVLKRDTLMTEWARDKSLEAKKCIVDEKKGFTISPVCLWVSEHQAAALNKIKLEITWTDLPILVKRMCCHFEDLVKHMLYKHMTHDHFPVEGGAGEKKMVIDFLMTPDKEFVDMTVVKPETRIMFRKMRCNDWVKKILPITATQTIMENVNDRTLRTYSEPMCMLENNFINTFDNVTFKFSKDVAHNCEHVLTKDCSGKFPLAVLVRNIHTKEKVVTILLGGKTKIEIMTLSSMALFRNVEGKFHVKVNGKLIENLPKIIHLTENEKFLCKIEKLVNGGIQVITPRIKVATDCERVVVQGHNDFRNRLCGLCGDFNGERMAEFRSPKHCPLSTGTLLVGSYAFPPLHSTGEENKQCVIKPEIKTRIVKEDEDCHKVYSVAPSTPIIEELMDVSEEGIADDECTVKEIITKKVETLGVCRTEKPIIKCKTGCHAKDTIMKKVWFNCMERSFVTPLSNGIRKQLKVEIPTICVRDV